MTTPFTYDFGYSWSITWGLLIPVVLFSAVAAAGLRLRWRRWAVIASALVVAWGVVGLLITHALFRINLPMAPPTDRLRFVGFRPVRRHRGRFRTGDYRPAAREAARARHRRRHLRGGIRHRRQQPERLMRNASIAGVADRVSGLCRWRRSSVATRDRSVRRRHQRGGYRPSSARWNSQSAGGSCTRPQTQGEFLLAVVNVDWSARVTSPHALGIIRAGIRSRRRSLLSPRGSISSNRERSRPCCIFCAASRNAEM